MLWHPWGGLALLPFISFHIPESAGLPSPTPQPAPGSRPPPLFLIPVSLGVRRLLQATSVWGGGGWGKAEGQFFFKVGDTPPFPLTPPGECNKTLTFLEAA